eukprot:scaffold9.g3214.t1
MKIYTRTGDTGTSSLYTGERRGKDDAVFAALGDVDELNSAVGVAREACRTLDAGLAAQLESIQSRLLDVGSAVATPRTSPAAAGHKLHRTEFAGAAHVAQLEAWIDGMTEQLSPLSQFILPGGGQASAFLHLARTVCRRAERSVVPLVSAGAAEPAVVMYLNRLSDYLFTAARFAALRAGEPETVWQKWSAAGAAAGAAGGAGGGQGVQGGGGAS